MNRYNFGRTKDYHERQCILPEFGANPGIHLFPTQNGYISSKYPVASTTTAYFVFGDPLRFR